MKQKSHFEMQVDPHVMLELLSMGSASVEGEEYVATLELSTVPDEERQRVYKEMANRAMGKMVDQ